MSKIVSANRLADGIVVFLVEAGHWTHDIGQATVFPDTEPAALHIAKADEARNLIVDPSEVALKDSSGEDGASGRPEAVSLRNAIRAKGPTIDFLPKSSGSEASQRS
jgi:hypothetical protein